MRWRLKTALTLNFVLLASLPVLISGFGAVQYLTTRMEKEISEKNLLLASSYASELDRFFTDTLHRLEHVGNLLADGTVIFPGKVNDYLASAVFSKDDLEMVRVLDQEGGVTHLAPFDRNIYGLDMSRQTYTIAAGKRQAAYWSSVFISPQTGAPTLVLAIPFKGGMVVGHLALSAVHEIIASIHLGPGGSIAVLDRNGTTIAHQNRVLVAQRANLSNQAHIARGLTGNEGNFRYEMDGQGQVGSIATVRRTGWVVAVSQPQAEMFVPIKNLTHFLYAVIVLTVLTAVVASVLSLQRMLSPLNRLTLDTQKIANGNYKLERLPAAYREIEELSDNFKIMIDRVSTREVMLRESESRFRATFEQAAVGITHVGADGQFLRVNRKLCDIIGYSHEEMWHLTIQDITHPDDFETGLINVQGLLDGQRDMYSMEKRAIRKSGEIVWVNLTVSIIRGESDAPDYFVTVIEDISERKKAEGELKRLHAYTEQLIETANVMIIGLDKNGQVMHFNPAAEAISGYNKAEIEGKDWFAVFVPDTVYPEVHQEYNRLLNGDLPRRYENPVLTKSGEKRFISWSNSTIRQGDNILGTISFGMDITEIKQAEQKLLEYQDRLKALATQLTITEERERRRLAANLHDQIGQTLALTRMQLAAAQKAAPDAGLKARLGDISQSLLQTVKDTRHLIYDLSPPQMNEVGLAAAISDWLEEQIEKRHGLGTELIVEGKKIALDHDVRALLFRNTRELLTNAVKHARANNVTVRVEYGKRDLKVVVKDDGVGFDPDALSENSGASGGFGLFSIQERMADLGGAFDIASAPGKGCTAVLTLPVKAHHP